MINNDASIMPAKYYFFIIIYILIPVIIFKIVKMLKK